MLEQSCRGGGIRTHDSPLAAVTDDPRPKVGQILTLDGALPTELTGIDVLVSETMFGTDET